MPRTAGWTTSRRGQDSPWKSQSEWQRTEINGESTSMVWTTLGSRTARDQIRSDQNSLKLCRGFFEPFYRCSCKFFSSWKNFLAITIAETVCEFSLCMIPYGTWVPVALLQLCELLYFCYFSLAYFTFLFPGNAIKKTSPRCLEEQAPVGGKKLSLTSTHAVFLLC